MKNVFKHLREKVERDVPKIPHTIFNENYFNQLCEKIGVLPSKVLRSIGTLGGG